MSKYKFENYQYVVSNRRGFALSEALRLWRTKYDDLKDFDKEVITHEAMHPFRDFVHEVWNSIIPVTVEEALNIDNAEIRRTYFDCIGVERLFKQLNPILRDKQTIKKKRTRWDDKNDPYEYEFEDHYELYEIEGRKLFKQDRWGQEPNPVYAVRCWCTTTNREYWLYVPELAAAGRDRNDWRTRQNKPQYDAVRAIAWTIRIDVIDPEKIYRQGDIVVAKMKPGAKSVEPYHLNKDQYLQLMYSET